MLALLTWADNSNNEDDFIIERSLDGVIFTEIGRAAQDATAYNDNTVTNSTTYFYRVVASNVFNTGTSSVVSVSFGDILSTPIITSFVAGEDAIELHWSDNNIVETGYAVYRAPSLGGNPPTPGTYQLLFTTQPNEVKYVNVGLTPKTTYLYKLKAIAASASSNSAFTDAVVISTQGQIPVTPSSLNATAFSQTEVQIEWKDNASVETGFEIYRSLSGDPGSFTLITTAATNVESYIDQGLTPKTDYYYQVRATGADGPSPLTPPVTVTTLSNVPESPTDLTVAPVSGAELQLTWTDNSDNENGFIIARATEQFGSFTVVDTVGADLTLYLDSGLINNTTYFYVVRAFNSDGLSEKHTNVATEKTANVPLVPVSIVVTPTGTQSANITWGVNAAPSTEREAGGYTIEVANILGINPAGGRYSTFVNGRKTFRTHEDDLIFYQLGSVDASTRSFDATNLIANQKYIFRVRAFNDNGNSPYTAENAITTLIDSTKSKPSAPSDLIAESVSPDRNRPYLAGQFKQ